MVDNTDDLSNVPTALPAYGIWVKSKTGTVEAWLSKYKNGRGVIVFGSFGDAMEVCNHLNSLTHGDAANFTYSVLRHSQPN